MPDWGKVLSEIAKAVSDARTQARAQAATSRRTRVTRFVDKPNQCLFWNCDRAIKADHIFCYPHFQDFQDGEINECPGCGQAKDAEYDVCLDCYRDPVRQKVRFTAQTKQRWYKPEYSPTWEPGDAAADRFYVYILKLDGGEFYAGQTREIRERLMEHRDGTTKSTVGRNPRLVWFTIVPTRDEAEELEVELKKLVDGNPREVRRLVRKFQDLVEELDFD